MPLYAIDNQQEEITKIPYQKSYRAWVPRMLAADLRAIKNELNSRIDGGEVHTSSWIPGANWRGTVFEPIYTVACKNNQEAAAKCFGLILWEVMTERPEKWAFGHYELNNLPIEGLTYFRIE